MYADKFYSGLFSQINLVSNPVAVLPWCQKIVLAKDIYGHTL